MNKKKPKVRAFIRWYRRENKGRDFNFDVCEYARNAFDDGDVDHAWRAFQAGMRAAKK